MCYFKKDGGFVFAAVVPKPPNCLRISYLYFFSRRRCGPKRRKSCRDDSGDDSDATSGVGGAITHGDGYGHGGRKVLNSREQQFLAKFYSSVNKFIPMTCLTVIRDAMNPLPLDVIRGISSTEVRLAGRVGSAGVGGGEGACLC